MSPMVDKHLCDASSVVVQQPSEVVNLTQFVYPVGNIEKSLFSRCVDCSERKTWTTWNLGTDHAHSL